MTLTTPQSQSHSDARGALFYDPVLWSDMDAWHARTRELRESEGIVHVDEPGYSPFWALLRHEDVFNVSRDNDGWHNTAQAVLGTDADWQALVDSGMPPPCSLVQLDGEKHREHRKVTNEWFKPRVVATRQPRIDELCDLFIQRMRDMGGRCDFAKDIAAPYTLRVIMDIYGVPEEDEPLMLELTQGIFGAADPEFLGDMSDPGAKVMGSVMQFVQYFNEVTQDRRACPADDLATVIANGEVNGELMGDYERLWYYIIVATAGHDTTSYALAGGMERFTAQPDQLWAIRDEPDLVNQAADEIIRYTTPVRHFLRWATRPQTVGGVEIPEGGHVLLSYPSANRDGRVFADPDTFDVRRADADKLFSFGGGAHFCLGAQFARREVRTMIGRLSQELSHVERVGDVQYSHSHFVSGVKHLPIEYRFK